MMEILAKKSLFLTREKVLKRDLQKTSNQKYGQDNKLSPQVAGPLKY